MKKLGLVLALVCVTCLPAVAVEVTFDIYPGYESVSCPVVPFNPEPSAVFNGLDFENGSPSLVRMDAVTKNLVTYDFWSMPDTAFGGILLGDGYLVWNDTGASATMTVDGVPDGVPGTEINPLTNEPAMTDMWISLPKAGWSLIGYPYNTPLTIDQDTGDPIFFTDGTSVKRWNDAVAAGWIGDNIQRFNGTGWSLAGYNYYDEDQLLPGKGYYIYTNVDNLAMIITAPDKQ